MRRLSIILLAAAAGVGAFSSSATATVPPTTPATPAAPASAAKQLAPVDVVQVSGLLDEILIDEISHAIAHAETDGAQALIVQLNTAGAVVSRDRIATLIKRMVASKTPIGIWVGPSGAGVTGLPAQLLAAADVTAMAPGARMGNYGVPIDVQGATINFGAATDRLRTETVGFKDARTLGALKLDTTDEGVPTVKNMVLAMDGLQVRGKTLDTITDSLNDSGGTQKDATLVRFFKLGLLNQLMHTVSSPAAAYLLLIIGLALLVFEFFTAGVGVGGGVGAICTILACFGLAALPVNGIALALIFASMFAFAIDVQVGIPRLWTGVGLVLFIAGSWFLFRTVLGADLRPSWITLLTGVGGIALTFIVGMPSMVRTRFATPTVGREWMIGEMGTALAEISPEGIAVVSGGRWRARTNRATPIAAGATLRVVAIDGVTLEVEPELGGAQDYRERRKNVAVADDLEKPGE